MNYKIAGIFLAGIILTTTAARAQVSVGSSLSETEPYWFQDKPVFGQLPEKKKIAALNAIGDKKGSQKLQHYLRQKNKKALTDTIQPVSPQAVAGSQLCSAGSQYDYTGIAIGFVPRIAPASSDVVPILFAGNQKSDPKLKNSKLRIDFERLNVVDYPGFGVHSISFDFFAENQLADKSEAVHWSQAYEAQDNMGTSNINNPIFLGLNVADRGVSFKGFTINVKSSGDEAILKFLKSQQAQQGLTLATTAEPVLAPFVGLAVSVTEQLLSRTSNAKVMAFNVGLDFTDDAPFGVRLNQGSYIIVQIPNSTDINWDEWNYKRSVGEIVLKGSDSTKIPCNYVVFGVTKLE